MVPGAPRAPAPAQTRSPGTRLEEGHRRAAYLSVSCHDQRSGSGGLRLAARHGQGGGETSQQGRWRLQTELVNAGRCAGRRVRVLGVGKTTGQPWRVVLPPHDAATEGHEHMALPPSSLREHGTEPSLQRVTPRKL